MVIKQGMYCGGLTHLYFTKWDLFRFIGGGGVVAFSAARVVASHMDLG